MAAAAREPVGTGSAVTAAAAAAAVAPQTGFGSPGLSPAVSPPPVGLAAAALLPVDPVAAASPWLDLALKEEEGEEECGVEKPVHCASVLWSVGLWALGPLCASLENEVKEV